MAAAPEPPLPSFMIIGNPCCGTRWLRHNLDQHPDVHAPPRTGKEPTPWLFDDDRRRASDLRTYRREFVDWAGEPLLGVCEPTAMVKQWRPGQVDPPPHEPVHVARRIAGEVPDVRLVAIVREPIERLEAGFRWMVEHGELPRDADPGEMLTSFDPRVIELDLIAGSAYADCVREFIVRFGEQLLVVFFEDLRDDPAGVYQRVLSHIGASTDFVPDGIERVLFRPHETVPVRRLTTEERETIYRGWYVASVRELEELTGRDLSSWDRQTVDA
jgi:hypothetical protein